MCPVASDPADGWKPKPSWPGLTFGLAFSVCFRKMSGFQSCNASLAFCNLHPESEKGCDWPSCLFLLSSRQTHIGYLQCTKALCQTLRRMGRIRQSSAFKSQGSQEWTAQGAVKRGRKLFLFFEMQTESCAV